MSGTALNAASVGLVVVSLLLCPFEHPTTLIAITTSNVRTIVVLFICNALCKSTPTMAPVVVLKGSFEDYEKFQAQGRTRAPW